jgi:hypothetical protein
MECNQPPRARAFIRRWPKAGDAERLLTVATRAQEAAQLARLRFDSGVTDFLIVLDAEREVLSNRDQLAKRRPTRRRRWSASIRRWAVAGLRRRRCDLAAGQLPPSACALRWLFDILQA